VVICLHDLRLLRCLQVFLVMICVEGAGIRHGITGVEVGEVDCVMKNSKFIKVKGH
jgi:hypothetical protein